MISRSALLAGYRRRVERREALAAIPFREQRAFISDPARLAAALCTRRAGKSTAIACDILETHDRFPGAASLYVGLTRDTCKRIMWPILQQIDQKLKLGLEFKRQELAVVSDNGSITYFLGCDSSEREMAKAVGQKYPAVWVDEAQDFRIDLYDLITRRLRPATIDYHGKIRMSGTPGDFFGPRDRRHMFFAITKPAHLYPDEQTPPECQGWITHRWHAKDNPGMRDTLALEEADIEATMPAFRATPQYRREYLGEWVIDDRKLVYHHGAANTIDTAPQCKHFAVGVDLGWTDATAFTVVGWRPHDPALYVLRSYKQPSMSLSAVADEIKVLRETYGREAWLVIDGANRQGVEEIAQRFSLPLELAEKHDKATFIRLMNSDLATGTIRVVRAGCAPLLDEWETLIWDERAKAPKELSSCENHCSDSALYAWRTARNYLWSPEASKEPARDSEAWIDKRLEERSRRVMRRDEDGAF